MPLDATIGTSFLNTYGRTTVDLQTFAGDSPLVGIYFSAHWCGPCRNFTPKLVTFLTMLEEEGVRLPVVFGSSDKDEASFQSYFASMTGDQWHAFPLGDARHPSGSSHPEASADAPVPRQPAPAPDRVPPRLATASLGRGYGRCASSVHTRHVPRTQARIETLKKQFGVSGIPWLVILDREGNLVLNEADETIGKGTVAYHEWLAKASNGSNSPMARP